MKKGRLQTSQDFYGLDKADKHSDVDFARFARIDQCSFELKVEGRMKKVPFILALVVLVAGGTSIAQANDPSVLSLNAVGYVKIQVEPGKVYLLRTDFEPLLDTMVTLASLIGDQLPSNTTAYIWDRTKDGGVGGYRVESYVGRGRGGSGPPEWPSPPAATAIQRGDAFWLVLPDSAAESVYDLYLMGEVPGTNNQGANTTITGVDVDAIGYPYPIEISFGNTTVAASAPEESKVFFWDPAKDGVGGYVGPYVKVGQGRGGGLPVDWPQIAKDYLIKPGEAFWLVMPSAQDWTEFKPYEWP